MGNNGNFVSFEFSVIIIQTQNSKMVSAAQLDSLFACMLTRLIAFLPASLIACQPESGMILYKYQYVVLVRPGFMIPHLRYGKSRGFVSQK